MKRAMTTFGLLGLAAFAVAAPAVADRGGDDSGHDNDDTIIICHAGSGSNSGHFTVNSVAVPSLNGHGGHDEDIIPPNDGMKYGQNWDDAGRAIHANGCVVSVVVTPEEPPVVEEPPVYVPPVEAPPLYVPPVEAPPVYVPPVDVEQPAEAPPVTLPPAAAVVVPEQPAVVRPEARAPQAAAPAATTSLGTNQGYNAQTAVGSSDNPSWLAGLGALAAAGAAVAFRRRSRSLPSAR